MMKIVKDIPLNDIDDDEFGREPLVELIVESINNLASSVHPCMVYGIYGKWGEGKSTLMNFIKNRLIKQGDSDRIIIAEFNPWLIDNNEALLREFFKTIMVNVDEEVRGLLKKYGSLAIWASKTVVNAFIPGVGNVVADGVEMLQKVFDDSKSTLAELKKSASDSIKKSNRHLIVMVDDVDRLDKEELHSVLRLIRQVADFKNCIYLVAMDDDLVAKSIGDYYGVGTIEDGHRFLDKIVQIPIKLPKIPLANMSKIVKRELNETLSDYTDSTIIEEISAKITPMMHTYRDLKRYCNQLSFVLPYMMNEVNIKDLCVLEAIKVISTEAYDRIHIRRAQLMRDLSEDFPFNVNQDESGEIAKSNYDEALKWIVEGLDDSIQDAVKKAIDDLFSSNSVILQMDLDEKCLCTNVYFPKYFALDVPSDIIPDKDIDRLESMVNEGMIEEIANQFDKWLEDYQISEIKRASLYLIRKTELDEQQCRAASVIAKVLSICRQAKNYPAYSYIDPEAIATFVPSQIISKYMYAHDAKDGVTRVVDKDMLNETLDYIFKEGELNYCLNLIYPAKEVINIEANIGNNALLELIDRFRQLSYREQLTYSRFILVTLFNYWKRVDNSSFCDYANILVSNPEISLLTVFDKFIDDENPQVVLDFVSLFKSQITIINQELDKMGAEQANRKSVRIYKVNFIEAMREK